MLLRADCSRDIGTGHVFRCLQVADYFFENGWSICFLINDDPFAKKVVSQYSYDVIRSTRSGEMAREIEETKKYFLGKQYDVIIVDFYDKYGNDDLMEIFSANSRKACIAITDEYEKVNTKSHILIASHPQQSLYDYGDHQQTVFAGERYFIVSPEFKTNKITIKEKVENIFISFGGHDPDNVMGRVTEYLIRIFKEENFPRLNLKYLIGGIYMYEEALKNLLVGSGVPHTFYKNVSSIVPIVKSCDMAITGGGNTLYELCNMGVPCMVITQNERQNRACTVLDYDKGLIDNVGFHSEVTLAKFRESLLKMLLSGETRAKYSTQCLLHFGVDILDQLNTYLTGEKSGTEKQKD